MTCEDIKDWKLDEFLTEEMLVDKTAMNGAFFAKVDAVKASKQAYDENDPITKDLLDYAKDYGPNFLLNKVNTLIANRDFAKMEASNYLTSADGKIKEAYEMHCHAEALQGRRTGMVDEIKQVLSNPYYKLNSKVGGTVYFDTRNPVICVERNAEYGVDRKVNLGLFQVSIDLSSLEIRLKPSGNNVNADGHYHPYLSAAGKVCWGNSSDAVAGMLAKGELARVMALLPDLLSNFSGESTPYVQLKKFEDIRKGIEDDEEENECDGCGNSTDNCECCGTCNTHVDNCECFYCEQCGETSIERCGEHWCSVCRTYDGQDCSCCRECDSVEENCDRCRECDSHDDIHNRNCERNLSDSEREAL